MPRTAVTAVQSDLDDQLQRALQEVHYLKEERNDLQTKLKHVQTQFRRLTADLKLSGPPDIPVVAANDFAAAVSPKRAALPRRTAPSVVKAKKTSPASVFGAQRTAVSRDPAAVWRAAKPGQRLTPLKTTGRTRSLSPVQSGAQRRNASSSSSPSRRVPSPLHGAHDVSCLPTHQAELEATQLALRCCTAELEQLRATNAALQKSAESGGGDASKTRLSLDVTRLSGENAALQEQLRLLRAEVERLQQGQQQAWQTSQQQLLQLSTQLQSAVQTQQNVEQQYQRTIQSLTVERDDLRRRAQSLEDQAAVLTQRLAKAEAAATSSQRELLASMSHQDEQQHSARSENVGLQRRLQQVETELHAVKADRQRVVEELQLAHTSASEMKRDLLQRSQEKAALDLCSERVGQLEKELQLKSAEVGQLEQQLLQSVASIQSCNRELEEAVRQELSQQVVDLEQQLEEAHHHRREKERESLECRQQVAEAKRSLKSMEQDMAMYKTHIEKLEKEYASSSDLGAAAAVGEVTATDTMAQYAKRGGMTEEEMHKVFAVAALRKRSTFSEREADGLSGLTKEANTTLDLFESLGWDEQWEVKQLREALATAALDLELADQHAQQERVLTEQHSVALQQVTAERDALLEENIEMRRRLSHVQTVFAKQQLQAYRTALTLQSSSSVGSGEGKGLGQINLCLRAVQMEVTVLKLLQLDSLESPTSLFFSLDGLEAYDTMLSPTFYNVKDVPVDILFQFDGLEPDEVTVAEIQRTTFVLQLHHCTETGSEVVAQAELCGAQLLRARELSLEETLLLIDGDGVTVGHVLLEFSCLRLMLPVSLGLPILPGRGAAPPDGVVLSALETKAALVALRSVVAIRVQVFRLIGFEPPSVVRIVEPSEEASRAMPAQGPGSSLTVGSSTPARAPDPYVFYTTSSPVPIVSGIRDTVVRSTGGGPLSRTHTPGGDVVFDQEPVEHRVAVDKDLIQFLCYSNIVFVVFDANSTAIEQNLGTIEIPLKPLMESPQALIHRTEVLHPRGKLSVGLSWKVV